MPAHAMIPNPSITGALPREVTVSRLLAMSAVFLALSVCARVAPGRAATPSPIPTTPAVTMFSRVA